MRQVKYIVDGLFPGSFQSCAKLSQVFEFSYGIYSVDTGVQGNRIAGCNPTQRDQTAGWVCAALKATLKFDFDALNGEAFKRVRASQSLSLAPDHLAISKAGEFRCSRQVSLVGVAHCACVWAVIKAVGAWAHTTQMQQPACAHIRAILRSMPTLYMC